MLNLHELSWRKESVPEYLLVNNRMRPICEGCGQPILKNLAFLDGEPWHFGELRDEEGFARATHVCRDCCSYLTPGKVGHMMINGERWRVCGVCGSTNLKWLGKRAEVFYP